jgi:hypothetical protein
MLNAQKSMDHCWDIYFHQGRESSHPGLKKAADCLHERKASGTSSPASTWGFTYLSEN